MGLQGHEPTPLQPYSLNMTLPQSRCPQFLPLETVRTAATVTGNPSYLLIRFMLLVLTLFVLQARTLGHRSVSNPELLYTSCFLLKIANDTAEAAPLVAGVVADLISTGLIPRERHYFDWHKFLLDKATWRRVGGVSVI